jgi:hypothetical protein
MSGRLRELTSAPKLTLRRAWTWNAPTDSLLYTLELSHLFYLVTVSRYAERLAVHHLRLTGIAAGPFSITITNI